MIRGIGIDVVDVERFESIMRRTPKIKTRLFTSREIKNSYSMWSLAGKFAAKEAVLKSMGTGLSKGLTWRDLEILGAVRSQPYVVLSNKARKIFEGVRFFISISHEGKFVVAVCLATYSNT